MLPAPGEMLIAPQSGWPALRLSEIWTGRELLTVFVWREITVRYKQAALGVAWAVLQPLVTMVVLSIVFGRLARLDSDGAAYAPFCLAGLVPWLWFSSSMTAAANSLVGNVNLLTKVHFPRVLLPLSHIVAGLIDVGISLVLLAVVLAWHGIVPGVRVALLPASLAIIGISAAGAGLWLSALHARYRDVRYALPFCVQIGMYATPIVYSLSIVPAAWRPWVAMNPLVGGIALFRWTVLGTPVAAGVAVISSASAAVLFTTGLCYFRATERDLADVI